MPLLVTRAIIIPYHTLNHTTNSLLDMHACQLRAKKVNPASLQMKHDDFCLFDTHYFIVHADWYTGVPDPDSGIIYPGRHCKNIK